MYFELIHGHHGFSFLPGHSLGKSYSSSEMPSMYSTAPADWTTYIRRKRIINTFQWIFLSNGVKLISLDNRLTYIRLSPSKRGESWGWKKVYYILHAPLTYELKNPEENIASYIQIITVITKYWKTNTNILHITVNEGMHFSLIMDDWLKMSFTKWL